MMPWLDSARATFSPEIGLDLGTANTVVYDRTAGVFVSEPSMVAYETATNQIVAVGNAAREMEGRNPKRYRVVRPLRDGTISDYHAAQMLVGKLVDRALRSRRRIIPRLVASVPGCATDIECKAVEHAVRSVGARSATFVAHAVCAAIGAGLNIDERRSQMVVDIGAGTTEIAIVGLGGLVRLSSLQVGGDHFDEAIIARLLAERFAISRQTAERIKMEFAYLGRPQGVEAWIEIGGTDLVAGAPRTRGSSTRRWSAGRSRRNSRRSSPPSAKRSRRCRRRSPPISSTPASRSPAAARPFRGWPRR